MSTSFDPELKVKEEAPDDEEWLREGLELDELDVKREVKTEAEDEDSLGSRSDYEIESESDDDEEEDEHPDEGEDANEIDQEFEPDEEEEDNSSDEEKPKRRRKNKETGKISKTSSKGLKKINNVTRKALEKLCSNAPLTDWVGSQCKYVCFKCKKPFSSWGSLNHHLRTEPSHGPVQAIEKHITNVVCYECKICQRTMLADRGFLLTHIKERHGLNLKDYAKKYLTSVGHGRYKAKQDHMNALLDKARVSETKAGNHCEFKCKTCQEQFKSWNSLKEHLSQKQHGTFGMETVGDYITKIVSHACLVCSKVVLCDNYFVIAHIKRHKISLPAYCKKYANFKYSRMLTPWSKLANKQNDIPIVNDVGNLCKFECDKCKYQHISWGVFAKHLKKEEHGVADKDPTEYMVQKKLHECHICQEKMICDLNFITTHVRTHHNVNVKEYKAKYGLKKVTPTFKKVVKVSDEQRAASIAFEDAVRDIPICGLQMSDCMPPNSLTDEVTTDKVGNLCRFKCHSCPQDNFVDWALFRVHSLREHQYDLGQCHDAACIATARYHRCQVCARFILADPFFLRRHLRDNHKEKIDSFGAYCDLVREKVSLDAVVLAPKHRRKTLVGAKEGEKKL